MPAASAVSIVSSARGGTISGYESRSSPYPSAKVFLSRFGTVSDRSYPEAIARLSQLSFSSWAISAHRRMVSAIRSPALPQTNSLPGLTLNEPSCGASRKLRSEPRRGISRATAASPALTDPAHIKRESVPVARFQKEVARTVRPHRKPMGSNCRITPKSRDYAAEPPSHWTSTSPCNPALRASNVAGDEIRLLSLFGGQVYRMSDPTIQTSDLHVSIALTIVKRCFTAAA